VAIDPSLYDPSGKGEPTISLQVLPRNRCTPSIPPVLHVFESLREMHVYIFFKPKTRVQKLNKLCE